MKNLSQHRRCPARNSDLEPTEYKSRSLSSDCLARGLMGGGRFEVMQFFSEVLLFIFLVFIMNLYMYRMLSLII
jgi:hypothetical protein